MKEISNQTLNTNGKKHIEWPTALFLTITPIIAVVGTPLYIMQYGFHWPLFLVAASNDSCEPK